MSFVTTRPEALAAAANNLQAIGAAMTAQNAAAATPTTGVAPAAADEVSALQATQFSAYGTLYQQISAQVTAIQDMFVNTLRTSSESYDTTEAANVTGNGAANSPLSDLLNMLTGSASGPYSVFGSTLSNAGIAGAMQVSNFGSAASDLLQLGSAGFLAPGALTSASSVSDGAASAVLTNAGSGAPPVSVVGSGQSASTGKMSAPPSWAGAAEPAAGSSPAPRVAGWTAAAAEHAPASTVPAAIPAAASEDRRGGGRMRYGVKPKVAPRATGV